MENPYTAPSANLFGSTSAHPETIPLEVVTPLQGTKVWVRVVSVALWLLVVVMMLIGASSAFVYSMAGATSEGKAPGMPELWIFIFSAIFYPLMGILYIFPAIKLWAYGSRINRLVISHSLEDLIAAMDKQRSFWKFIGIVTLVILGITLILLVTSTVNAVKGR